MEQDTKPKWDQRAKRTEAHGRHEIYIVRQKYSGKGGMRGNKAQNIKV